MDYIKAFIIGGLLCVIGQILIDKTKLTPARILVSYVVAGVFLGGLGVYKYLVNAKTAQEYARGLGVYKYLVDFAGAGATIPLTGFGYTLAKGVREAVKSDGFLGVLTGGLKATAGGITAAITAGLLVGLIFKAKDKS